MYIQGKAKESMTFDAIVVGSGISGGWAAKELTEKGLKVLMIERGRDIQHITGYENAMKNPWDFPHRGQLTNKEKEEYYAGARAGFANAQDILPHFVKDVDYPFAEKRRFDWVRGYQTGGRSLTWGKQSYRWNRRDFEANLEDGHGVDWPIRYDDLAPWYDYVERFAGVSGSKEGLDVLPDGVFQTPMELNCVEKEVKKGIESNFENRHLFIGRAAHLTNPTEEQLALGRSTCQNRNLCKRGCPYGAYFSTQASTLPAAKRTENLTVVNDKIVYQTIFDKETDKVIGVKAIDEKTNEEVEYFAKIIFLNASAMNSVWIMMQSKSSKHVNGLGNDSDQLGRNIMDHHLAVGADGRFEGMDDRYYYGRRPNGIYIPRFANWGNDKREFLRGFGFQGQAARGRGQYPEDAPTFGAEFKENMSLPGSWKFSLWGFGETLPDPNNRMTLSDKKDKNNLPQIEFDAGWGKNEILMRETIMKEAVDMLEAAGLKDVVGNNNKEKSPGVGIHEMGTARMGRDPKTSVLNKWNQVWGAENVFVTDGAAMTSSSCVNPSLTYMALTARAANYAAEQFKLGNL
ncbi:GMC oxidoreductase [Arcticibacterium luteifluviistationis]|uniref:GMC family oxidoreductase n=1 Tax=Arcticibacterium luteifluviistationis TaxID=1784714 RepID=A0A2Z4GA57_9BACT|nr:GMC family oxidoreductase [Arcticibacterium luteifluviistationis]AWV97955.1 GMC family oxidoreductase [Arcticibacterium luteifluviistationis]